MMRSINAKKWSIKGLFSGTKRREWEFTLALQKYTPVSRARGTY
jgi:hypothetical protein